MVFSSFSKTAVTVFFALLSHCLVSGSKSECECNATTKQRTLENRAVSEKRFGARKWKRGRRREEVRGGKSIRTGKHVSMDKGCSSLPPSATVAAIVSFSVAVAFCPLHSALTHVCLCVGVRIEQICARDEKEATTLETHSSTIIITGTHKKKGRRLLHHEAQKWASLLRVLCVSPDK